VPSTLVGHEKVRQLLEKKLPPAALLIGPESVGKRLVAQHAAAYHGIGPADTYTGWELTAATARTAGSLATIAPFGPARAFLFDLDGASMDAQHALLKQLEEPPPAVHYLLVASRGPLPTIVSRCNLYSCGYLFDAGVIMVLQHLGVPVSEANRCGPLGRGQVAPAYAAATRSQDGSRIRSQVSTAIKAAMAGGSDTFSAAVMGWENEHALLFRVWAHEAATGRWVFFDPTYAPGATPAQARRALEYMCCYPGTNLSAVVALRRAFPAYP
jgi:hypothetical protein